MQIIKALEGKSNLLSKITENSKNSLINHLLNTNDFIDECKEETTNQDQDLQKTFNNALIEAMQMVNKNAQNGAGVWYYDEYANYCMQNNQTFNPEFKKGFANSEFWAVTKYFTFEIKPNKKSSEAVNAFLNGLTIADCGNMIVACQLAALLKVFGAEKFDAIFDNSIEPLTISQVICDEKSISSLFFDYADKKDKPTKGSLGNRPIAEGEMCHIASVPFYRVKHPAGRSGGFNVICLGKNANGEDLFLGFSPTAFKDKPLTESELSIRFIELYNLERTTFDYELISSSTNPSIYDMKKNNVNAIITLEDGLKNVKGYFPGSVIKPLYSLISKYQKMSISEATMNFPFDRGNHLMGSVMDNRQTPEVQQLYFSDSNLFKKHPIIYQESKDDQACQRPEINMSPRMQMR